MRRWTLALGVLALAALAACGSGNNGHDGDGGTGDGAADGARGDGGIDSGLQGDGATGDGAMSDGASGDGATSDHVVTCPGCPCFPGTDCTGSGADAGTPAACTDPTSAPTLVYPPDHVLLPPNTNVLEVQFQPGAGNTLFEIDFQNAVTDVRIITRCNAITNTRGVATNGCGFTLDAANWRYVAEVNRGGDPVRVTVRATPDDQHCVGTSTTREISFATEDVVGGIYYWQSVTVGGTPGRAGGIYRYDFGREDIAPEAFLESSAATGNRCIGCHFVSRDGQRISFGSDDPDSDDEYGDLRSNLMDISTRTALSTAILPGFRTFSRDHTSMLASDGRAMTNPRSFARYNGDTGALTDRQATGGMRATHPDWSADDSHVVYVQPTTFLGTGGTTSANGDDDHFTGGSLMTATWNGSALSAPSMLLPSAGDNNYYPAYSPDGALVLFNRVRGASGVAADAFSNPEARVWAMPAAGGTPVDLAQLNQGDHLSNSWPRWSPFVQHYKDHSIVWVTFSSIRDYGLRVQNQDPAGVSCYPPESPENNNASHLCPLVPASCGCTATACAQFCVQPQIWMAAVEVDATGGISAGRDTSHPAFWLPFQEVTAHNHVAQWVASIPGHEPPDGGTDGGTGSDGGTGMDATPGDAGTMCGGGNAPCGPGLPLCCAAYECVSGMCGVP